MPYLNLEDFIKEIKFIYYLLHFQPLFSSTVGSRRPAHFLPHPTTFFVFRMLKASAWPSDPRWDQRSTAQVEFGTSQAKHCDIINNRQAGQSGTGHSTHILLNNVFRYTNVASGAACCVWLKWQPICKCLISFLKIFRSNVLLIKEKLFLLIITSRFYYSQPIMHNVGSQCL